MKNQHHTCSIRIALFALLILFLGSCASQQQTNFHRRKHLKGWFIQKRGDRFAKASHQHEKEDRVNSPELVTFLSEKENVIQNTTSKVKVQDQVSLKTESAEVRNQNPKETTCDLIMLKDGTDIEAKVIKIGSEEIEYKKCGNETGPSYTLKRSDVFKIKYADGSTELISAIKTNPLANEAITDKQSLGLILGIAGIGFGAIGSILVFFPIVAIIFGAIGLILGIIAMKFAKDATNDRTSTIVKLGIWAVVAGASALFFGGFLLFLLIL